MIIKNFKKPSKLVAVGIVIAIVILTFPTLRFFTLAKQSQEVLKELKAKIDLCHDKPNCVSSLNESSHSNYMAPVTFDVDPLGRLRTLLKHKGLEIVSQENGLIHATDTSLIFRFVDDVYLKYDKDSKMLHFKSQSRVGYSDLGVNRSRMSDLLTELKKAMKVDANIRK